MNRISVPGQTQPGEAAPEILGDGEQARAGDEAAISPSDHNDTGEAQSGNAAAAKKRKRQLTRNACIKCRLAKAKVL